jgi:uncharacterized protein YbaA (DUF1428 family)
MRHTAEELRHKANCNGTLDGNEPHEHKGLLSSLIFQWVPIAYVDGFIIPIKKTKIKAYWKMALQGKRLWMKHGALDYKECLGEDLKPPFGMSFTKLAKLKKGETVIFAFITFKSRKHRDTVNARIHSDPSLNEADIKTMPFDMKRMVYGGFKVIVSS